MAIPKLQVIGLNKEFVNQRTNESKIILDGIDLEIMTGEFVAIVGPSGCGKTTFLRIIDGLTKKNAGKILLAGREVDAPGRDRGFVFQRGGLFPWRTVLNNVLFGLEVAGVNRADSVKAAQDLIKLVGLEGFENHYPYELSGGMQQRVNLARALAINPEILLMDEPFAALDAQTREIMQAELLRIWREYKKTVLFITHQIEEAVYLADRVVVFSARPGRVKGDLVIDLPRPRQLGVKRTEAFLKYVDRIWDLIEEEVKQAMAKESNPSAEGLGPAALLEEI